MLFSHPLYLIIKFLNALIEPRLLLEQFITHKLRGLILIPLEYEFILQLHAAGFVVEDEFTLENVFFLTALEGEWG